MDRCAGTSHGPTTFPFEAANDLRDGKHPTWLGGLENVPSHVTLGAVLCLEALSQVLGRFSVRLCIRGLGSLVYNAVLHPPFLPT